LLSLFSFSLFSAKNAFSFLALADFALSLFSFSLFSAKNAFSFLALADFAL